MNTRRKMLLCLVTVLGLGLCNGAMAQRLTTDNNQELSPVLANEEEEEADGDFSRSPYKLETYFSYSMFNENKSIGRQLGVDMPEYGIGGGIRMNLPVTKYFGFGYNFGGIYGIRQYTNAPRNDNHELILEDAMDARTYFYSFYMDFVLSGNIYFSKSLKQGMNIFAGIGYDYMELHVDKGQPGHALVADQKIMQHGCSIPMGLRFFFGNVSLTATYRLRAFDVNMTVEEQRAGALENGQTPIRNNQTLKMMPLELSLGFYF